MFNDSRQELDWTMDTAELHDDHISANSRDIEDVGLERGNIGSSFMLTNQGEKIRSGSRLATETVSTLTKGIDYANETSAAILNLMTSFQTASTDLKRQINTDEYQSPLPLSKIPVTPVGCYNENFESDIGEDVARNLSPSALSDFLLHYQKEVSMFGQDGMLQPYEGFGGGAAALVVKDDDIRLRQYQRVLADIAKTKNVIACLPTGSGKTQIGVELSKLYIQRGRMEAGSHKFIVFLAPTVPLTQQQGAVFEKYLTCHVFTGGHPIKSRLHFQRLTKEAEAIFFTPELFRCGLANGYISFNDVLLLIVDECHHTIKKHPINGVMHLYDSEKRSGRTVPRILGLTATLIKKNVSPHNLEIEIAKAEKLLDSVAVTYQNYEEVLQHSTQAEVTVIRYESDPIDDFLDKLLQPVRDMNNMMLNLSVSVTNSFPLDADGPEILGIDLTKEFNKIIRDVLDAKEYGKIGVVFTAIRKIRYMEDVRLENEYSGIKECIFSGIKSALIQLISIAKHFFNTIDSKTRVELWSSPKIQKIMNILKQYKTKVNTTDELCGLIFVQTQSDAYCLFDIVKEWISSNSEFDFIHPALIVGSVNPKQVAKFERITKYVQKEIIQRFRDKEINVIITTSILEEGIDIPSCGLVVRVDPLTSYVSMIQSMGRARRDNALYYVLTAEEEVLKTESTVEKFDKVKEDLKDHLIKRMTSLQLQ